MVQFFPRTQPLVEGVVRQTNMVKRVTINQPKNGAAFRRPINLEFEFSVRAAEVNDIIVPSVQGV